MAEAELAKPDGFPAPIRLWMRPIEGAMQTLEATKGKRLGDLTMPEILAWAGVFVYCAGTGMVIGLLAGNLAAVALRGPRG